MACPNTNIGVNGAQLNLVASITLPSLTQNLIQVEIVHDLQIDEGAFFQLPRDIYPEEDFGIVNRASFEVRAEVNSVEAILDDTTVIFPNGANFQVNFCLEQPGLNTVSFITTFEVNNAVCNIDGQQAIPASYITLLEAGYVFLGVDFTLPLGDNGFPEQFTPDFTPSVSGEVLIDNQTDPNAFTVFIPFSTDDLGYNANEEDVFLFLGEAGVPNAPDCVSIEEIGLDAAVLFVVALPLFACCCLVGVLLSNKAVEAAPVPPEQRRTRRFFFPGSPDIIVAPENSLEPNTVNAVLEDLDNQDLDDAVPITTIDVRMRDSARTGVSEDNRDRFVTI